MSLKVALLTPGYPPTTGGIETVVGGLAPALSMRGLEVEIWTHDKTISAPKTHLDGDVVVRSFPTTRSHRFPLSYTLWQHVRRFGPKMDVLHAHSYHASPALSTLRSMQTPLVFSPHYHGGGHTPLAKLVHVPYRPFGRKLFGHASAVVADSVAEMELIRSHFPGTIDRTQVICCAADAAEIHRAMPFDDAAPTLLSLGRLEAYKGVDRVLAAFAATSIPGKFVIVGGGPDLERLKGLVAAHPRRDDIQLLGKIDREDVNRWLRTARCVVSMSNLEAFGLVGLEGAAAGAHVVLSDIPSYREVAGLAPAGQTTLVPLTSSSSEADLVKALEIAMSKPNVGPQPIRSWTDAAEEFAALYERVAHRIKV